MRKWYQTCKHPTNEKLRFFTDELNRGHVRQERPKVTVSKLKIWWKNERQREKRNEQKCSTETLSKGEVTQKTTATNISRNENITEEDVNAQEQNMENERLKFNQNQQEQNSESARLKFPVPQYRFPLPEQRPPVIHQPFPFTNPPNPFLYGSMTGQITSIREEPFCNPPDG
ncbi:hypothetical protein KUTeg_000842 [Tegillarca granosa]|uniref:Homeobox domain-containing protein n=1 Tax=Tegillarca granosa TaxID=220873 RepID=A0ABQ9FYN3_TEGGR|nr:hypothetical protein KUTeg_000842 [Tegillarca granosa]